MSMLVMVDLDNTLSDRVSAVSAWVDEFIAENELPGEARQWILDRDRDGYADRREVFDAVAVRYALSESVDSLLATYQRRVVELSTPTQGAISCLRDLRAEGFMVAIVSNGSTAQQHGKIDALGLRDLVDAVIVSGDLGIEKPDAGIFEAASRATEVPLDRAWMVGDSPIHDIAGAGRCGAKTAWLRRGREWPDVAPPPTVTISSLAEVLPAVRPT